MAVYPCTYRELFKYCAVINNRLGISLYLQGTRCNIKSIWDGIRYIPVPTGNSYYYFQREFEFPVYPCTYRELFSWAVSLEFQFGISLYLQGTQCARYLQPCTIRYIPVPTGNSKKEWDDNQLNAVYPCTYRELSFSFFNFWLTLGISLYLQGTHHEKQPPQL